MHTTHSTKQARRGRTIHRLITIKETAYGWLNISNGRRYTTAIGAQNAVKREGKALARGASDAAIIQVITWETNTRAGAAIIKAIS